jgi:hypothetical protein
MNKTSGYDKMKNLEKIYDRPGLRQNSVDKTSSSRAKKMMVTMSSALSKNNINSTENLMKTP